jgi:hypothetical protein
LNAREQAELENAALANELSRQVAHDFSNFVYNLLLQIEIAENSSQPLRLEWDQLKRDGKHMADLLRQWEHFHSRLLAEEPTEIDLHELIRQVAGDILSEGLRVQLAPPISAKPLKIKSCRIEVKHLLRLLLEDAFHEAEQTVPSVSIQTEVGDGKAVLRIEMPVRGTKTQAEDYPSLVAATCRSLALRLDATIHRDARDHGACFVVVEFPMP